MKKITLQMIVIFTIFLFNIIASCGSLNQKPEHMFVDSDMLVTYADAQAAVNGIYTNLFDDSYAGGQYVMLSAKAGLLRDYYQDYFREGFTRTAYNGAWSVYYRGINYANFAINGIQGMSETAFKDEGERNALIGEAKLFRAWLYINAFKTYGHWWAADDSPYGLVYRDQVSNLSNLKSPRLTVGESYEKILEDLDAAILDCPTLEEFGSKKMTKEYAKVLKAKLLLERGTGTPRGESSADLTEALRLVNDVMDNLPTRWIIEPDLAVMYNNSFDSRENLFVRYDPDWNSSSRASTTAGFMYGYGLGYAPTSANNATTDSQGIAWTHDPEKFDAGLAAKNLDWIKADPRWPLVTGLTSRAETWDNQIVYAATKLYRGGYLNGTFSIVSMRCDYKFNVYYFRLYELYLLKAELILRTGGSYTDALSVLNQVRAQRTNPVLPALTASSREQVYNLIYREIVCELFFENGADYFASLRINSPDGDRFIEYNKKGDGVVFSWDRQCFQIPDSEVSNNPLATPQNPFN